MGAAVSYKLKNSLQGALAGGGDPATSPLYVFGPFLSLIVAAGVGTVTFGASVWLAVLTVIAVSAMYRYVMIWVTDGSGGSGLSEEEFGNWAVKINAAITVIEYTLTFLVSVAALVTFIADRFPLLNSYSGIFSLRTLLAAVLSIFVAAIVNRGSSVSSRLFGPATALILGFLWLMITAVVLQRGLHLPPIHLKAFQASYLHFTLGGFARILALMTGIEIFANLVASYEGTAIERSRRAFGGLIIVMGTTACTMLIVGPAIFELSDPFLSQKSVFTQTMDALLPPWLSYLGTLIGVAVLLSAAAASTQGIQNLSLGLRARHYIPASWGERNRYDIPGVPAWAQIAIAILCFAFLGTQEETYLALYAAGVFILLSMTGWSVFKRFLRFSRNKASPENIIGLFTASIAATCSSVATIIIFTERFSDGAWSYFVIVPVIYLGFDFFRKRLGPPPETMDERLSLILDSSPLAHPVALRASYKVRKILVPLDEKKISEHAFHAALRLASQFGSTIFPVNVSNNSNFIEDFSRQWDMEGIEIEPIFTRGNSRDVLVQLCENADFDLICLSSSSFSAGSVLPKHGLVQEIIYATTPPVLFLRPSDRWISRSTAFKKILVPLDGSGISEQVLPIISAWSEKNNSDLTLLSVPDIQGEPSLEAKLESYLHGIKSKYFSQKANISIVVGGSGPSRTILHHVQNDGFDLVAVVSHGQGGIERQKYVRLGSVTEAILRDSDIPVLFISARDPQNSHPQLA